MADTVTADHQDLGAGITSPAGKRKRGADSVADTRRTKRGTAAAMQNSIDAAAAAYMDAGGIQAADFSALQQAAAAEHGDPSDPANASSTAAAALGSMYPSIHVPQPTEETFAAQGGPETDPSLNGPDGAHQPDGIPMDASAAHLPPTNGIRQESRYSSATKPAVGSEEWHKMRKDNHKEVERRRRETINEGINELARVVPGCEKNKGSILQRAVNFITQLKENETQNIEKWTLEKLLTEQAINELSTANDKLKTELARAYGELELWKKAAEGAGLSLTGKEKAAPPS